MPVPAQLFIDDTLKSGGGRCKPELVQTLVVGLSAPGMPCATFWIPLSFTALMDFGDQLRQCEVCL